MLLVEYKLKSKPEKAKVCLANIQNDELISTIQWERRREKKNENK